MNPHEGAGVGKSLAFGGHVATLSKYSLSDYIIAWLPIWFSVSPCAI